MFGIDFKKLKRSFSLKRGMFFWYQHYKSLFFFGFIAVLGLGGFLWYKNLYQYHWSEEQKKEFISIHFKATNFKEKAFQELVADLRDRAKRFEEPVPLRRDLFSGDMLQ